MNPEEFFRVLRAGGYAVDVGFCDGHWKEITEVFGKDREVTFDSEDLEPEEALIQAGFIETELHSWRFTRTRSLEEIIMTMGYAPILRDFDETADRPLLSKLEILYGAEDGIRMTEGEYLVIGRKGD